MEKAALVAHLKKMFAAEDYFTGVLGNRHSVYLRKPRAARPKVSAARKHSATFGPARRSPNAKAIGR